MIAVTQTKRGGPDSPPEERGDCFAACLASVLEVPIAEVPCPHTEDWWQRAQQAVARHGYGLVCLMSIDREGPLAAGAVGAWLGPVYWLAGVPSLNLGGTASGEPVMHVIVMRGGDVVHDPSLGARYPLGPAPDLGVLDVLVLVELEPRSALAA